MTEKKKCEIFLAINEDGDYAINEDGASGAVDLLVDNFGGTNIRVIRIVAHVTPPEKAEIEIDVPDEAGTTTEVKVEDATEHG